MLGDFGQVWSYCGRMGTNLDNAWANVVRCQPNLVDAGAISDNGIFVAPSWVKFN